MSLVDARGNPFPAKVRNRYEGALSSPSRSWLMGQIQSANRDVDNYTRRELLRKARWLWKNSPTVRALIERIVTYVVGTGLHPTPQTSDDAFNTFARQAWRGWARRADLQSRKPFETLQRVIVRSIMVDGDIGTLLTFGKSGKPRIQLIESHLITNGTQRHDGPDGVTLDDWGRPESYTIAHEGANFATTYETVAAENLILSYIGERAGQQRGVTILASALAEAHDVDDIVELEKIAVKDASSKTDIIKTASGELEEDDGPGASLRRIHMQEPSDGEAATRFYREVFGPEAKVLKIGDEFTPYIPGRPSPAWQGFMDFLVNTICLSTGLSPSLLYGTKVGGADTRREIASSQRVIEVWQQEISADFQRVYEYVIGAEIEAGNYENPPSDWRSAEWQYPARLTVDAGREAQQDREDVKAGLLTREEYFARWGLDWREQLEQSAREAAYLRELANRYGVDVPEIAMRNPNEFAKTQQPQEPNGQELV